MAVPVLLVRRVVIDIVCIILVYVPWLILHWGKVQPFQRGFYCDDESLKHPFHKSSISGQANTALCIIVPILVILVTESVHFFTKKSKDRRPPNKECDGVSLHPIIYLSYNAIAAFLLGCAVQQTIVNIIKFSVGRLRPHFFDICQPDWSAINCTDPISKQYVYVEDAKCLGTNLGKLADVRLSFPSGHSSMSSFSMVFTAMYLQGRLTWRGSRLLRPFLQAGLIYVTVYICVSRISDYKHHWSDVLGGLLIGVLFAVLTGRYVWDFFEGLKWKRLAATMKNGDAPTSMYDIGRSTPNPTSEALSPSV